MNSQSTKPEVQWVRISSPCAGFTNHFYFVFFRKKVENYYSSLSVYLLICLINWYLQGLFHETEIL